MHLARAVLRLVAAAALAAAPAHAAAQAAPRTIPVRLGEYRIEIPDTVKEGQVVLAVTNAGQQAHAFIVRGHRALVRTPQLQPGQTFNVPMRLVVGDYLMYCSLKNDAGEHRKMGMEKRVEVIW
jgi:hypothetical protein